MLCRKFYSEQ